MPPDLTDDNAPPAPAHDRRPDPLHPGSGLAHVKRAPVAPGSVAAPQDDEELKLPHERDESVQDSTADEPDPRMVQAKKDLDAGQMDTDMRSVPGLDAERRARAVGGAASTRTPPSEPDS